MNLTKTCTVMENGVLKGIDLFFLQMDVTAFIQLPDVLWIGKVVG